MLPPTSYLPPIKDIKFHPLKTLNDAIYYLRRIYNPEVRGSRRRRRAHPLKNSPSSESVTDVSTELLDILRTDIFERNYAIKWLTTLISQLGDGISDSDSSPGHHQPSTEDLIQNAASLLALCAGTASAGVIVRQFVFQSRHEDDIKVELVDEPLDNHDYRSVGAQTWGGACIMAEMIVDNPRQFGFHQHHLSDAQCPTFRCLELGAGTGLVSLTVAKMMQQSMKNNSTTKLEVVATDYYPSVLTNLERNVSSNFFPQPSSSSLRILSRPLDWSTFSSQTTHDPLFETPFDLILGTDIIYESQHALWIKSCLTKLLRKPSSSSTTLSDINPTFHLIIPLRATHRVESNTIEQVFPFNNVNRSTELVIHCKEIIICDAQSAEEGEDIEYAYYKIGWGVP